MSLSGASAPGAGKFYIYPARLILVCSPFPRTGAWSTQCLFDSTVKRAKMSDSFGESPLVLIRSSLPHGDGSVTGYVKRLPFSARWSESQVALMIEIFGDDALSEDDKAAMVEHLGMLVVPNGLDVIHAIFCFSTCAWWRSK